MKHITGNYEHQHEFHLLKRSLAFYSDWIEWNMDDSTQKNVSIEWSRSEDEETSVSYFTAVFYPDKAFARGLEDGDLLSIDYMGDGRKISFSGVALPVMLSTGTDRNGHKIQQMRVQIKFRIAKDKKAHDDLLNKIIFLINSLEDVTVVNIGLFKTFLKQRTNMRFGMKDLAADTFLCKILSITDTSNDESDFIKSLPNIDRQNKLRQQVILDNVESRCYQLNDSQKVMIEHALNNRVTLVMGPPGTGKTHTSAVLACNLYETRIKGPRSKILVCASSNVAVDNLAMAIYKLNKVNVVRIRSPRNENHYDAQPFHLDVLLMKNQGEPFDEYRKMVKKEKKRLGKFYYLSKPRKLISLEFECEKKILYNADIICCTCSGALRLKLFKIMIDSLIIDECSQVCVPEGLLPVQFGPKRIVLVGDDNQLGPVIKDRYADKYCDSNLVLYSKLKMLGFEPKLLDLQYRMHPELVKFANKEFYDSRIRNGVSHQDRCWTDLNHICPFPNMCTPIYFQCHSSHESKDTSSTSRHNSGEIRIVVDTIKVLLSRGVQSRAIGVITPYMDQCKLINDKLKAIQKSRRTLNTKDKRILSKCTEVEVATVDAYQGREKDYIIVSFVRSSLRGTENFAFIADARRLNVTLTRAKYGMIIIGNPAGMDREPLLYSFIKDLSDRHLLYDEMLSEVSKPLTLEQFESKYFRFNKQPRKIEIIQID